MVMLAQRLGGVGLGHHQTHFYFWKYDVSLIRILRKVMSAERLGGGWFGAMMATQHYYFSLSLTLDGATCQP